MSSMSPILVTNENGDVSFTAGGSGGSRIISSVAQVVMYNLWLGKSVRDAVDMPRLHQQLIPMELELEKRFPVVCSPTISLCSFAGLLSFVECRSWSVGERSYYLGLTWWIRRSSNRTTSSQWTVGCEWCSKRWCTRWHWLYQSLSKFPKSLSSSVSSQWKTQHTRRRNRKRSTINSPLIGTYFPKIRIACRSPKFYSTLILIYDVCAFFFLRKNVTTNED